MPHSVSPFDFWVSTLFDLLQPATVCDIGPGAGKYGRMAREKSREIGFQCRVTAFEIDESYVDQFGLRDLYDEVILSDAVEMISHPRVRYDLVIIGDCIEHMRKSAAIDLLNFLVYRSGYILVVTPEDTVQDDWEGHAAEAHISTWSSADFSGWNVLEKSGEAGRPKMNLFLIKGFQSTRMLISG